MKVPYRQYKKVIQQFARDMRNNPTPGEAAMWKLLRMDRFFGIRFLRQRPIFHHQQNCVYVFIADFYCHEHKKQSPLPR